MLAKFSDTMMMGDTTSTSNDFISGSSFDFFISMKRVIKTISVEAKVEVDAGSSIIYLSYTEK